MMRSLFSGMFGLKSHQTRMDVIGNNIANVNTYGFKSSRVNFQDVLSQTLRGPSSPQNGKGGTNAMQVGLGVKIGAIGISMTQGSLQTTGNSTDLSIDGDGFFVLSDGSGYYYTRAGAFGLDANRTLIDPGTGLKVMGWTKIDETTGEVDTNSPLTEVRISPGRKIEAKATTRVKYACNLDYSAVGEATIAYDPNRTGLIRTTIPVGSLLEAGSHTIHVEAPVRQELTGTEAFQSSGGVTPATSSDRLFGYEGEGNVVNQFAPANSSTGFSGTINVTTNMFWESGAANDQYIRLPNGTEIQFVYDDGSGAQTITVTIGITPDGSGGVVDTLDEVASVINSQIGLAGLSLSYDNTTDHRFEVDNSSGSNVDVAMYAQIATSNPEVGRFNDTFDFGGTHTVTVNNGDTGDAVSASYTAGDTRTSIGDTILITGTNKVGGAVNAVYTITASSTMHDLLSAISNAFEGSTATLDAGGHIILVDDQGGASNTSLTLTFQDTDPSQGSDVVLGTFSETTTGEDAWASLDGGAHVTFEVGQNNVLLIGGTLGGYHAGGKLLVDFSTNITTGDVRVETTVPTYSTSIEVYDSLGNAHNLRMTFTRDPGSGDNTWKWEASLPDEPSITLHGNTGRVSFYPNGLISNWTFDGGATYISFTAPGAEENRITPVVDGEGSPINGITQFASPFTTKGYYQDGYPMGVMQSFSISSSGDIIGLYSNGRVQPIAKIALALFNNPEGLLKIGNSMFSESSNSGRALITAPGKGGAGELTPSSLEMSNVDLATQLTEMIIAQRGFSANSRIITTTDEMLQELLGLKR